MQGVIPEHLALSLVDIWFQDEARVGQQGTLSRVWEMTGTRPRGFHEAKIAPNSCIKCPR